VLGSGNVCEQTNGGKGGFEPRKEKRGGGGNNSQILEITFRMRLGVNATLGRPRREKAGWREKTEKRGVQKC